MEGIWKDTTLSLKNLHVIISGWLY